jgi:hypothetical protein
MTIAHDHADLATTQALSGFNGMVGVTFAGQQGEQTMHSSDVAAAVSWGADSVDFSSMLDSKPGEEAGVDLSNLYSGLSAAPNVTTPAAQAPVQAVEGLTEQDPQDRKVNRRNDFGLN